MFRPAAVLALAAALPPGTAAPVPAHLFPKDELYYPTRVGTEWVYDDDGQKLWLAVTEVEEKVGVSLVTVCVYNPLEKAWLPWSTVEVSRSGLRETDGGGEYPKLRLPCAKGDRWESSVSFGGKKFDNTFTAGGVEVVKVPAGTFRAARVDRAQIDPGGKPVHLDTCWYAPGVGLVRHAYRSSSTRDLVSFTPGKPAPPGR